MATTTGNKRKTASAAAAGRRKTAGTARGSSTRRNAGKEKGREISQKTVPVLKEEGNPLIMREAGIWLLLAACIFMFISYFGVGGFVGHAISDVCFGLFGCLAYLLPFLVFLAVAFLISNKGNRIAKIKFLAALVLYICLCSLTEIAVNGYQPSVRIDKLYQDSAALRSGGGAVGGILCSLICPALGTVGAGVVLGILSIVSIVLVTQKSLFAGMKRQGEKVVRGAKNSKIRREERSRAREERREEARRSARENSVTARELSDAGEEIRTAEWTETTGKRRGKRISRREEQRRRQRGQIPEERTSSVRTQIDVPIQFPAQPRSPRMGHKVTGVTLDTKLEATPGRQLLGEVGEVVPKAPRRKASVSAFPNPGDETRYVELGGEAQEEVPQPEKEISVQIHGIDTEEYVEVESDITPPSGEAVAGGQGWELKETGQALQEETDFPAQEQETATDMEEEPPQPALEMIEEESDPEEEIFPLPWDGQVGKPEEKAQGQPAEKREAARESGARTASSKKKGKSTEMEIEAGIASVEEEMARAAETVRPEYVFPPLDLLKRGKSRSGSNQEQEIKKTAAKLQQTLKSFGVNVTVTEVCCGPSVTRYELLPEQGVKVSRIVSLADDIKLNLAAADIRIEAPIPGKSAVGIEVPNAETSAVMLRDLLESEEFQRHPSKLAFATGKDIAGKVVVSDIARMPHLLIAGATGSGKSVCINTLIMSILYKAKPEEVKLIMIDPKVVELSVYNGIPHLFIPVVTDPKKAAGALNWGVSEMMNRYDRFAEMGVRDLKGYNQKVEAIKDIEDEDKPQKLPQIIIIVDELADLMMVAPGEVEDSICRLAQLARAAGIHLIIATQRPSVNVITGLIKANMPSRIAFSVSSGVDSRTIIDMNGAEKLLGKGDMLFYPQGYQKPARVQGAFVSDEEVSDVVDFLKNSNMTQQYSAEMEEQIAKVKLASAAKGTEDVDDLFHQAGKFIIEKDKASIGMLQRVFKIGFNRAARIMDQLSDAGVVGPEEGTKPRKVLMTLEQFESLQESGQ